VKNLTLLFPAYNCPELLAAHVEEWANYPCGVEAIVVDDHSDTPPIEILRHSPIPVRLYRVRDDIAWNQPGARNLGMLMAQTRWVLSTDADHLVPAATMRALMAMEPDPGAAYTFAREDASRPHPNTWLLTRDAYWNGGGFDEDYAGHYGHDDTSFRRRLKRRVQFTHLAKLAVRPMGTGRPTKRDPARNAELLRDKKDAMPHTYIRFHWKRLI